MSSKPMLPNISALDKWVKSPIGQAASNMGDTAHLFPVHGITEHLQCTCGKENCPNAGKHPFSAHGVLDSTNDIVKLAELFKYRTDLNLAMATGEKSSILIIDIDGNKGGWKSLAKLEEKYGELPNTPTSITGNGNHRFFDVPSVKISNRSNALGAEYPGIDVRSNGGYIVIPPSRHITGKFYQWMADSPSETPKISDWLLELLAPKEKPRATVVHDYRQSALSEWSVEEVQKMLAVLSPDMAYADWLYVGMSLHEGGFQCSLWNNWSQMGSKYQNGDCDKRWRGFNPNNGITMGSLVDMAQLHGWKPKPIERPFVDTSVADELVDKIQKNSIKEIPIVKMNLNPLELPGLIGDTVRSIVKYALQPQPELALLNTLAFAGAVFGRRYASPMNTRTNLYIIGIARTAGGKDHSRQYIANLAEESGLSGYMGAHYIRSDVGMLCDIVDKPTQLLMVDEIGMYLEAISNPRAPTHIANVSSILTKLYTSSGTFYDHGRLANPQLKNLIIQRPNLCVYGTTTEKNYIKSLRTEAIESGELNRFLVFKSDRVFTGDEPKPPKREIDSNIVSQWKKFNAPFSHVALVPPNPTIVEWNDECEALQRYYYKKQMQIINSEKSSCLLWGRYMESIIKVAMIFAISRDSQYPQFSSDDFKIAEDIVDCCMSYMEFMAKNSMADSPHEAIHNEVLSYIKTFRTNAASKTQIMRKFRKLKRKDLDDLLFAMEEQELIQRTIEEKREDGSSQGKKKNYYKAI